LPQPLEILAAFFILRVRAACSVGPHLLREVLTLERRLFREPPPDPQKLGNSRHRSGRGTVCIAVTTDGP
jgi:hypothetical protein